MWFRVPDCGPGFEPETFQIGIKHNILHPPPPALSSWKCFARLSSKNKLYPFSCDRQTKIDNIYLHSFAGIYSCEIRSSHVFEYYSLPGFDDMQNGGYRPLNGVWFLHHIPLRWSKQIPPKCGMYIAKIIWRHISGGFSLEVSLSVDL
jgi:hypothetical protein